MGQPKIIEQTKKRMEEMGYTRLCCSGAETFALEETLPKECVKKDIVAYYPRRRYIKAGYVYGCYFKSPIPNLSVEQILSLSRFLWKQEKGTLRMTIKKVLALEGDEIEILLVAKTIHENSVSYH